jgi:hypothetical protein
MHSLLTLHRWTQEYPRRVRPNTGFWSIVGRAPMGGSALVTKWYEIHVRGEVPAETLVELEEMTAVLEPAATILSGAVPDQAALHGILFRLQALGLELIEIRRLPDGGAPPGAGAGR